MCDACCADHAERFRRAYELDHYAINNGWRRSSKNPQNVWRYHRRDGNVYTCTVIPSKFKDGEFGFVVYSKQGIKTHNIWNFKSQNEACEYCDNETFGQKGGSYDS